MTDDHRLTAIAIITETVNRNRLNVTEPIEGDPLQKNAAAGPWLARAKVLHELIGSSIADEASSRATIAFIADLTAILLERVAAQSDTDPFEILQRIALG